jgi:hypothetical protein
MRETILDKLVPMMGKISYNYQTNANGVKKIAEKGIEFNDSFSQKVGIGVLFSIGKVMNLR